MGCSSAVVTFREHPKTALTGTSPALLTTTDERLELLRQTGINRLICLDFPDVRHLTAEAFMRLLHHDYDVDVLLMGYDHRFGCDRLSSIDDYIAAGIKAGVQVLLQQQAPDIAVSSTRIRHALQEGRIEDAGKLLGYPYALTGTVEHGRGLGRQLGFPTANIRPDALKLIPAPGVYATRVGSHWAITNIGTNPTVGNERLTIETHLPDFSGDLYGKRLTLTFLRRIRGEQCFPTLDALSNQIAADIRTLSQLSEAPGIAE